MEIKKIHVPKPLTFSKSDIQEIIKKIQSENINWTYEPVKYDADYWSITVAPNGEIIYPKNRKNCKRTS